MHTFQLPKLSPGYFKDNYKHISHLGEGGFGVVFKARHLTDKKVCAVKRVHIVEEETLERFLRESESHSALEHPNIVAYNDSWLEEKTGSPGFHLYIAMELGNETLEEWLREHSKKTDRPVKKMKHWMQQLRDGLDYIHAKEMIHRDLKPSNILLFHYGETTVLKISDFGLAKATRDKDRQTISQHTRGVGTRPYMAPEMFDGRRKYDKTVDIYAMGLIFIEMAFPMNREDRRTASEMRRNGGVPEVLKIDDEDTKPAINLKETLLGMTERNPDERWRAWSNPDNYFRK